MCRLLAVYGHIPILKDLLIEFQNFSINGMYIKDGIESEGHQLQ